MTSLIRAFWTFVGLFQRPGCLHFGCVPSLRHEHVVDPQWRCMHCDAVEGLGYIYSPVAIRLGKHKEGQNEE